MTKTKIFSFVSAIIFAISLNVSSALAEDYLADVENLTGEAIPGGVTLSWDSVPNADSYTIYYGTISVSEDGGSYEDQVLAENTTSYDITDLDPEMTYYFSIAAEDLTGQYLGSYNYSNEIPLTPLAEEDDETPPPDDEEDETPPPDEEDDKTPPPDEEDNETPPEDEEEDDDETLPESGPGVALVLGASTLGAYIWRRRKNEKA